MRRTAMTDPTTSPITDHEARLRAEITQIEREIEALRGEIDDLEIERSGLLEELDEEEED
jgi:hypothetical protein